MNSDNTAKGKNNKDIAKPSQTKKFLFWLLIGIVITGLSVGVLYRFGVLKKEEVGVKATPIIVKNPAPLQLRNSLLQKLNNGSYAEGIIEGEALMEAFPNDFLITRITSWHYKKEGVRTGNQALIERAEELEELYNKQRIASEKS